MACKRPKIALRLRQAAAGLAAAATALALTMGFASSAEPLGASFKDDFTTFDTQRWYVSDGWSNGAHQNCQWSASAVTQAAGQVMLAFVQDPTPTHAYRCGEIQTNQRFGYGTYEARIKTDDGSGLNAAFFTYIGPVHGERHDEIDFEILTANVNEVTVNTYVDGQPQHGAVQPMPRAANAAFHVYSFVWEPGRLRWFVDGKLIHAVEHAVLPERPQKIYLSLWGTDTLTDWMGPFVPPDRPKQMEIDWVAFTAPGEGCAFDGSVLCSLAAN
ncbi:MAG: family 16 glycosylhydrolase [Rhodobacteraceae bacterium]|nr:family 16 glycosylhydrolase [Paracoccaceae bacterium]